MLNPILDSGGALASIVAVAFNAYVNPRVPLADAEAAAAAQGAEHIEAGSGKQAKGRGRPPARKASISERLRR